MPDPRRLIISSNGSDSWLRSARSIIDADISVGSEQSCIDEISKRLGIGPALDSIEIVSHSTSEPAEQRNCLKIRDSVLDSSSFSTATKLAASSAQPTRVYIAGCLTADGSSARGALMAMEKAFGVPVLGTTRLMSTADLDSDGVLRDAKDLWSRPSVERLSFRAPYAINAMTLIQSGAVPVDFQHAGGDDAFGGMPPNIRALLDDLFRELDPDVAFQFPGMLALPTRSVYFSTAIERGEIDLLFTNRLVRIIREFRSRRRIELLFPVSSRHRDQVASIFQNVRP